MVRSLTAQDDIPTNNYLPYPTTNAPMPCQAIGSIPFNQFAMLFFIVAIVAIIIAVVLFKFLGNLLQTVIGLAILAVIVILTFTFPYVMIPLMIIGYFYNKKKEENESD